MGGTAKVIGRTKSREANIKQLDWCVYAETR